MVITEYFYKILFTYINDEKAILSNLIFFLHLFNGTLRVVFTTDSRARTAPNEWISLLIWSSIWEVGCYNLRYLPKFETFDSEN